MIPKSLQYQVLSLLWFVVARQDAATHFLPVVAAVLAVVWMVISLFQGFRELSE